MNFRLDRINIQGFPFCFSFGEENFSFNSLKMGFQFLNLRKEFLTEFLKEFLMGCLPGFGDEVGVRSLVTS